MKESTKEIMYIIWCYIGIIFLAVFTIWQFNDGNKFIHCRGYKQIYEFIKFIGNIIL